MTLTVRLRGDDQKHAAFFGEADVGAFVPGAADAFEEIGDALAADQAALGAGGGARRKAVPIGQTQGLVHDGFEFAAVVEPA